MQFYQYRNKSLLQYKKFKEQPPTTWTLVKAAWRLYAALSILIAVYLLFPNDEGLVEIKLVSVGMFFGMMVMTLSHARLVANMGWPVLEEVIDWNLVEEKCSAIESDN